MNELRLDAAALPAVGATVVVAVSGGADSVALFRLLVTDGRWPLCVYHLDHGLRAESRNDAAFVAALAAQHGVPAICERVDINALAAGWRVSIETAGRRQRLERFTAVARDRGAAAVETAHHRDDQAETVLANLLRGAGPIGCAGIPNERFLADGITLVRPLLHASRAELRTYLAAIGQDWREDASNAQTHFRRNHLRHAVLPVFEAGCPGFSDALAASAERARAQVARLDAAVSAVFSDYGSSLLLAAILAAPLSVRFATWRRLLLRLGLPIERRHLRRLDDLARGENGRRFRLSGITFARERTALAWTSGEVVTPSVLIETCSEIRLGEQTLTLGMTTPPSLFPDGIDTALFAAEALRWPLSWRSPRPGERWQPLGAPGSQTVRRALASRRVPPSQRAAPVLADADGVLWIPGWTIAERARVRADTSTCVQAALRAAASPAVSAAMSEIANPAASTTAVILAAGKGTRMGSDLAKVLHPLAGQPLVTHVLRTCRALGVMQTVVVVGWQRERVSDVVTVFAADTVIQDQQLGTGHAVLVTEAAVRGAQVLVLCGDCPMTPPALLHQLLRLHESTGAACAVIAARLPDPTGYGRMLTDAAGRLTRIVEHKDATDAERAVTLVNSGIYVFARAELFRCLKLLRPTNAQGEYYLTDVVAMLVREGRRVELLETSDIASVLGVNTPADLANAERLFAARAAAIG